jgi:ribonuclease HI
MATTYTCRDCGSEFTVQPAALKKYPGWTPKQCLNCRFGRTAAASSKAEALERFDTGPATGVFTDGACEPNPGPGGWGAVKVVNGEVLAERSGHDPQTTNNRMELTAMINGYQMLEPGDAITVFSDSIYCVRIATEWAALWEMNGWRRGKKREAIENLDLVKELYALVASRPLAKAEWIKGHGGARWNEYADVLSRAYQQPDPEGASESVA